MCIAERCSAEGAKIITWQTELQDSVKNTVRGTENAEGRAFVEEEKLESRYASAKLACRSSRELIKFMTKEHQKKNPRL